MKLLGMDYGRRRIGFATTDETGTIVRGLTTIDRKVTRNYLDDILSLILSEQPSELIVGLPLNHDNEETEMTAEIRAFVDTITQHISIPVHFVDESYSSIKASELMRCRKKKERREKTAIDRVAACLILEMYISDKSSAYR